MAKIPKFDAALTDRRSPDQQKAERAVVQAQIVPWVAQLTGAAATRRASHVQTVTQLQERSAGVTFELDDGQFPVTPYRLLVRADDEHKLAGAMTNLDGRYAAQVVPIPGLDDLYLLQDIDAGTRRLRSPGAVASAVAGGEFGPSFVAMMGAVRKAVGGPEPSGPQNGVWKFDGPAKRDPKPHVVIIDTGVSAEVRGDGWLAGLPRSDNLDMLNVVPVDDYLDLGAGHGTFTAGIVEQVAPGARIDVRIGLNTDGFGDDLPIGQAIIRAAEDGAEIINLSLGLQTKDKKAPFVLESSIRTAIRVAREKHGNHLLLVCAAGNYADTYPCWPAALSQEPGFVDHVISVAALRRDYIDPDDVIGAEWSTHGKQVTFSTFGQGVVSTYVVGKESPSNDPLGPDTFGPNSWAVWSGTSFAAPQVTGAIVRLMREKGLATDEALKQLKGLGAAGVIPGYGISIEILPV